MARIIYSQNALDELDRLTDFIPENAPDYAPQAADLIIEAVSTLAHHPLIGRPVEYDLRKLLISRGRSGYVALYSLEQSDEIASILAIRHQSDIGYD